MELAQKYRPWCSQSGKLKNYNTTAFAKNTNVGTDKGISRKKVEAVKELILSEVNIKDIEFVDESKTQIVKNLKLNF